MGRKLPKENLIGRQFGRLTVLGIDEVKSAQTKRHYALCVCSCGATVSILARNLKKGLTQSCGCFRKEKMKYSHTYTNSFENMGDYYLVTDNQQRTFKISLQDYQLVSQRYWEVHQANGSYVISGGQPKQRLHRVIMGLVKGDGKEVDHINHDPTDNRRENLRIVTRTQNNMNHSVQSNSKTGLKGISFDRGKWVAYIGYHGKCIHLGRFASPEEAVVARKEAEKKYFGEYAYNPEQDVTNKTN